MTGLRERKKAATREALGDAAWSLCVEHGLDGVTVEQIARAAGVSLRTFFNYFSSKEEAVVAGDGIAATAFAQAFADRPDDEPVLEGLRAALHKVFPAQIGLHRLRQLRELRRHPTMLPHFVAAYAVREKELTAAIAKRVGVDPVTDPYPLMVAAAVMGGFRATIQWWLETPDAVDRMTPDELVDRLIDQLAVGLRRPS